MEYLTFVFIIALAIFIGYIVCLYFEKIWKIIISIVVIWILIGGYVFTTSEIIEKKTTIDCYIGKPPYKPDIKYKRIDDSTYIPIDTVWVKN